MAEDHRVLFSFYLSMMYARGTNQFSESEWKIFLNWTIPSPEYYQTVDQQLFAYESVENGQEDVTKSKSKKISNTQHLTPAEMLKLSNEKWSTINSKLIRFFRLPNDIIAPLIHYTPEKLTLLEKYQERKDMIKPPENITVPATPTGKTVAVAMAGIASSRESANKMQTIQPKPSLISSIFQKKSQFERAESEIVTSNGNSPRTNRFDDKSEADASSARESLKSQFNARSRSSSMLLLTPKHHNNGNDFHFDNIIETAISDPDSPVHYFNPLLAKFHERHQDLPAIYQDGDQMIDTNSPQKKKEPVNLLGNPSSSFLAQSRILGQGAKSVSQFQLEAKKNTFEINYNNFKPHLVMAQLSKKFITTLGKDLLERFLNSFSHFQSKGNLKIAISSLVDQQDKWLSFVQNSLTDFVMTEEEKREVENEREKYASMSTDEEDENQGQNQQQQDKNEKSSDTPIHSNQTSQPQVQLHSSKSIKIPQSMQRDSKRKTQEYESKIDTIKMVPFLPKEIVQNCSFLQLLFIFKHFRPDFLPQIAEYSSQRILKGYINNEKSPMTLEDHCQLDWQKRPTIILHNEVYNRVFQNLELLQSLVNPDSSMLRISVGSTNMNFIIDQISNPQQINFSQLNQTEIMRLSVDILTDQAAGAGRWILLEEIEQMEGTQLKELLRALDSELEATTTTKTFRVWLTHNVNGGRDTQMPSFKPFSFSKNHSILSSYYQTCWKIYYSHPKNIQQSMERYFYREIHDFEHNIELQPKTPAASNNPNASAQIDKINSTASLNPTNAASAAKATASKPTEEEDDEQKVEKELILKKNVIVGNVVQLMRRHQTLQGLTPFPLNPTVMEKYYSNQSNEFIATFGSLQTTKHLNIFSFAEKGDTSKSVPAPAPILPVSSSVQLSSPRLATQQPSDEFRNNYTKFYHKFIFSLSFLHACMGIKRDRTNVIQKSYDSQLGQQPNEQRDSDLDFQQGIRGVFTMLQYFPNIQARQFIEKYIKNTYKLSNPYYTSMLLHFVFSSESNLKLVVRNYSYLLYDFNSGVFEYFEEGVKKIIQTQFPSCTDPLDLFFAGFNNQVMHDYAKSKKFIHKINLIEKEWKDSTLAKSLRYLDKLNKEEIIKQQSSRIDDIQEMTGIKQKSSKSVRNQKSLQNNPKMTSQLDNYIDLKFPKEKQESQAGKSLKLVGYMTDEEDSKVIKSDNKLSKKISLDTQTKLEEDPDNPFTLTQQQQKAIDDIHRDMELSQLKSQMMKQGTSNKIISRATSNTSNQLESLDMILEKGQNKTKNELIGLEEINETKNSKGLSQYMSQGEQREETQLINEIGHQARSFFKIYYRNLLRSHHENRDLKELLESLIQAFDYEFRLKEIPFIRYKENVKKSTRQYSEIPAFLSAWVLLDHIEEKNDLIALKQSKKSIPSITRNSATVGNSQNSGFNSLSRRSAPMILRSNTITLAKPPGSMSASTVTSSPNSKILPFMRKASFADKMKISRLEQNSTGQQDSDKKPIGEQVSRRASILRFDIFSRIQPTDQEATGLKKKNQKEIEEKIQSEEQQQPQPQPEQEEQVVEDNISESSESKTSSEESDSGNEEDQVQNIEQNSFKSAMLNEVVLLFRVILQIKGDLKAVVDQITNQFDTQQTHHRSQINQILQDIQNNLLPESWRKLSFKVSQQNLSQFLQILFMKINYTQSIVSRGIILKMPNVIHIDRLVDPFSFLGSYLYNFSQARNIDIIDLKLFLDKVNYSDLQAEKPADGGFYIKGLFLNNGAINKENQFLADEETRQFQFEYPVYQIQARKKSRLRPEVYHKAYEPIIAIELNDSDYIVSRYDMENEYAFQRLHPIKLYNYDANNPEIKKNQDQERGSIVSSQNNTLAVGTKKPINAATSLQKTTMRPSPAAKKALNLKGAKPAQQEDIQKDSPKINKHEEELKMLSHLTVKQLNFSDLHSQQNYNFVIKIPIKNSCTASAYSSLQSRFCFFFNSRKPQDYWDLKGTYVSTYKQHL